jgi:hypothetical protein
VVIETDLAADRILHNPVLQQQRKEAMLTAQFKRLLKSNVATTLYSDLGKPATYMGHINPCTASYAVDKSTYQTSDMPKQINH